MSKLLFIGIDNGATGSIGMIGTKTTVFTHTPTIKKQDYTKKRNEITRVDVISFRDLLLNAIKANDVEDSNVLVAMERPLVNPTLFKATCSALRSFECELCIVEMLGLPHIFIDSKEWQKELLPQGTSGKDLKRMSKEVATRLFPQFEGAINKQKDGDGILIAEWLRRHN